MGGRFAVAQYLTNRVSFNNLPVQHSSSDSDHLNSEGTQHIRVDISCAFVGNAAILCWIQSDTALVHWQTVGLDRRRFLYRVWELDAETF
jgi:hypothetical protein